MFPPRGVVAGKPVGRFGPIELPLVRWRTGRSDREAPTRHSPSPREPRLPVSGNSHDHPVLLGKAMSFEYGSEDVKQVISVATSGISVPAHLRGGQGAERFLRLAELAAIQLQTLAVCSRNARESLKPISCLAGGPVALLHRLSILLDYRPAFRGLKMPLLRP